MALGNCKWGEIKYYGVYGIYFNKKLVYIGKTSRYFYQRFSEHKSYMKYQGGKLYEEMRKFKDKNVNNKINYLLIVSLIIFQIGIYLVWNMP